MTHEEVLAASAALLNDQSRDYFTDAVLLAYYNLALAEAQETFELNNIPTTNSTSAVLEIEEGEDRIIFAPDPVVPGVDYLPANLVEIRQAWYSMPGQNNWFPIVKKDYLTGDIIPNDSAVGYFAVWAWMEQEFRVLPANTDLDVKLDYIRRLFTALTIGDLDEELTTINLSTALSYRTAGLAAEFVDENPSRSQSLNAMAAAAMDRSLGISTKGRQSIMSRRKPFRAAWKARGRLL